MGEGLSRLIGQLEGGYDLQDAEISALSDLNRDEAGSLRSRWTEIPVATRAVLLERAAELADVNLDYNFEALARIGLEDPEAEVRERAVTTLWESTDRDVGERLAEVVVDDPGPGVRAAAALSLAGFVEAMTMGRLNESTGERIAAALRRALDDSDVGVRAAALEAAGALPDEWVPERILEGYESDERDIRLAAIRAMGASALDRWVEYLEDQFYSTEMEFRLEAVLAAGQLGSELLIEPLAELLNDDDPEVVLAAIMGIGEIGGDDAVELLTEYRPVAPEGLEEAVDNAIEMAQDGGFRRFGDLDEQLDDFDDEEEDE